MSWSRAFVVVVVLGLGPTGCGFHPLYGRPDVAAKEGPSAEMAAIRVDMIADRAGQKLRNELVSRFNPRGEPVAARYVLSVKVDETLVGLATSQDGTATFAELTLGAAFTLRGSGTNVGTSGMAQAVVSSNFLGARYASVAAERDAEDRAIAEVADKITSEVAVYLNNPASRPPIGTTRIQHAVPMQHYQVLEVLPPEAPPAPPAPDGAAAPQ